MALRNGLLLEMSYLHLAKKKPVLAAWLERCLRDVTGMINKCATRVTLLALLRCRLLILKEATVRVRVANLPVMDQTWDLINAHLRALVSVLDVVACRAAVFPQLRVGHYECTKCRHTAGPFFTEEDDYVNNCVNNNGEEGVNLPCLTSCPRCSKGSSSSLSEHAWKLNQHRSLYQNHPYKWLLALLLELWTAYK